MNPWRNWEYRGKQKERKKGSEMVNCRIRGICNSGVCYGNPLFPWNLLETQEESFWLCSHDCTIFAGLIEWQKTQLITLYTCSTHTHSTYSLRTEKKASCSQFLDIASHTNFTSLISTQVTIHNPIFLNLVFADTSCPSHVKTSVARKNFIKW